MFSYSTGYYVSPPDDQYLKFKNRCSLLYSHVINVAHAELPTHPKIAPSHPPASTSCNRHSHISINWNAVLPCSKQLMYSTVFVCQYATFNAHVEVSRLYVGINTKRVHYIYCRLPTETVICFISITTSFACSFSAVHLLIHSLVEVFRLERYVNFAGLLWRGDHWDLPVLSLHIYLNPIKAITV
jgi:hypothetical protein